MPRTTALDPTFSAADGAAFTKRHPRGRPRRRPPRPGQHREAYGCRSEAVERCRRVSPPPQLGDGLLSSPADLHAIEPNPGGRRTVSALFPGPTPTGWLIARS
ncbi:hypothetical protein I3F60_24665 [Streptomyces sp. MUM 136J]|uniref:hypothetical protein n=1 Tax=Streptomyces sp. MUM 136J TaxID=2791992 RepID=UPI001F0500BF|nr:hypothetical protein [Streptomyces sp. MUM 136J]MCH0572404.1 hypothetical protein [Streptomyces sp. MUM 136J]